jgi:chemotaxis protein methyltransferase CheR
VQVVIKKQGHAKYIFCDGTWFDETNKNRLLEELKCQEQSIEVTFFGARHISFELILALKSLTFPRTVYCSNKKLWLYLNRLGLSAKFLDDKRYIQSNAPEAVVFGGSAGAMNSLMEILEELPKSDVTIFVVIHLKEGTQSILDELLAKHSDRIVKFAEHAEEVKRGFVYIAPHDKHMLVEGGYIVLSDDGRIENARPSIGVTFTSLGIEYQNELIAVLLSGYGKDGVKSLKNLMDEGSTVVVQDPATAEANPLLINAVNSGSYDMISSLHEIKEYLKSRIGKDVSIEQNEFEIFLSDLHTRYGYEFGGYDHNMLMRRTKIAMDRVGESCFERYRVQVLGDKFFFDSLLSDYSINISTFFRNPEVFAGIRNELSGMLATYPVIKVWSVGCASGEEAYSVAILLYEAGLLDRALIYATDFNKVILAQAKEGLFSLTQFDQYEQNYRSSGGTAEFKDYFEFYDSFVRIKDFIHKKVSFFEHNLTSDYVFNSFNLILCRNVIIYFDELLRRKVESILLSSMENGSVLVLGESEYTKNSGLSCINSDMKFYKRLIG